MEIIECGNNWLIIDQLDNEFLDEIKNFLDKHLEFLHNDKENYTLAHFRERINIYNEEDFNYEIHNVDLK